MGSASEPRRTLTTMFNVERPRGRTLAGHVVRIATCILAHTLCFFMAYLWPDARPDLVTNALFNNSAAVQRRYYCTMACHKISQPIDRVYHSHSADGGSGQQGAAGRVSLALARGIRARRAGSGSSRPQPGSPGTYPTGIRLLAPALSLKGSPSLQRAGVLSSPP